MGGNSSLSVTLVNLPLIRRVVGLFSQHCSFMISKVKSLVD